MADQPRHSSANETPADALRPANVLSPDIGKLLLEKVRRTSGDVLKPLSKLPGILLPIKKHRFQRARIQDMVRNETEIAPAEQVTMNDVSVPSGLPVRGGALEIG